MRNRDVLRLVGAASLAAVSLFSFTASANAWAGLSEKQQAHIDEFIHCKILLLTDIRQFEAEQPPCGGTPYVDLKSLAPTGSGVPHKRCEYTSGLVALQSECPSPE